MFEHGTSSEEQFLRRRQAADYLQSKYGFGAMATLAKGAVTGDTPSIVKPARWSSIPRGPWMNGR